MNFARVPRMTIYKRPSLLSRIIKAINTWKRKRETYKFFLSLGCKPSEARKKVDLTL